MSAAGWCEDNEEPPVQASSYRIQDPYWFDSDLRLPGMTTWTVPLEEAGEVYYMWIASLRYLQSLRSLREAEVEGFHYDTLHSH